MEAKNEANIWEQSESAESLKNYKSKIEKVSDTSAQKLSLVCIQKNLEYKETNQYC